MPRLSDRVNAVSESITLKVSAKAAALKKAGVDVVGFGAGEPDFDTPEFIKDAAKQALDLGQTKYTPTPSIRFSARRIPVVSSGIAIYSRISIRLSP